MVVLREERQKTTVMIAEGSRELRAAIQTCARMQSEVELCAVADSAQRLLQLLHAGLRPQVLVLDSQLPGCNLLALIRRLPVEIPDYIPRLFLTSVPLNDAQRQRLLTLGIEHIILKPYTPTQLFSELGYYCCPPERLKNYLVHSHLHACLRELGIGVCPRGVGYLEQMLCALLLEENQYTLLELYQKVAERESITTGAVASGVRRLAKIACKRATPMYARLCEENGCRPGAHLSNDAFVRSIVEYIRRAMYL